jgi:mannose-6-phosphate isomerase-like protein (cupin superfamily)
MKKTVYREIRPYTTKDGSVIRELMHPDVHGNANQSLAEAVVPVGRQTELHYHRQSEEIYHVTEGFGRMRLGDAVFDVGAGDTVCIAPGTRHNILNTGDVPLRLLCCSAPPYSHGDTELIAPGSQVPASSPPP